MKASNAADLIARALGLTALEWDESLHPRDDRGRFGTSGDGGPVSTPSTPLYNARQELLAEHYPGMMREAIVRIDEELTKAEARIAAVLPNATVSGRPGATPQVQLGLIDPDLAATVADRVERFATEFPFAAAQIGQVYAHEFEWGRDNIYGSVRGTGPRESDLFSDRLVVELNSSWWDNANKFSNSVAATATRDPMWPPGSIAAPPPFHAVGTPTSVIDHELGHVLYDTLDLRSDAAWEHLAPDNVSGYAQESASPNETFAEVFAYRQSTGSTFIPGADGAIGRHVENVLGAVSVKAAASAALAVERPEYPTCAGYVPPWAMPDDLTHAHLEFTEELHPRGPDGRFISGDFHWGTPEPKERRYSTGHLLPADERQRRYGHTIDEVEASLRKSFTYPGVEVHIDNTFPSLNTLTAYAQAADDLARDFPNVAAEISEFRIVDAYDVWHDPNVGGDTAIQRAFLPDNFFSEDPNDSTAATIIMRLSDDPAGALRERDADRMAAAVLQWGPSEGGRATDAVAYGVLVHEFGHALDHHATEIARDHRITNLENNASEAFGIPDAPQDTRLGLWASSREISYYADAAPPEAVAEAVGADLLGLGVPELARPAVQYVYDAAAKPTPEGFGPITYLSAASANAGDGPGPDTFGWDTVVAKYLERGPVPAHLSSTLDFDETQHPRDEHGRFTSGGGDDLPGMSDREARAEKYGTSGQALRSAIEVGFPNAVVKMPPEEIVLARSSVFTAYAEAAQQLGAAYPEAAADVREVIFSSVDDAAGMTTPWPGGAVGLTLSTDPEPAGRTTGSRVPAAHEDDSYGWWAYGTMVHEFGHAATVHASHVEDPTELSFLAAAQGWGIANREREAHAGLLRSAGKVSSYGSENAAEAYAEVFTADRLGLSVPKAARDALDIIKADALKPRERVRAFASAQLDEHRIVDDFAAPCVIDRYIEAQRGLTASSFDEDQHPRDDHGRFTEGGGAEGPQEAPGSRTALASVIDLVREQGGLSVRPLTGEAPREGFMVAYPESRIIPEAEFFGDRGVGEVEQFLRDHADFFDGTVGLDDWAAEHERGTLYRAMSEADLARVREDGVLTGSTPGEVWVSNTPKREYLDPGEVIVAIKPERGDIIGGGGPGDLKLREVPADRIFDQWNAPETQGWLGVWHDTAHHEVVLDEVENFLGPESQAVAVGSARDQQSIWDVVGQREIDTGGTGGRVPAAASARHPAPEADRADDRGGAARVRPVDRPSGAGSFAALIAAQLGLTELDWDPDLHPRDSDGRFGSGGETSTLPDGRVVDTLDVQEAGDAIHDLAAEDFGVVTPATAPGVSPWGHTEATDEHMADLRAATVDALGAAGYDGHAISEAIRMWGFGDQETLRIPEHVPETRYGADQFLTFAAENVVEGSLTRGAGMSSEAVDQLAPGTRISMGPSSWSRDADVAKAFDRFGGEPGGVAERVHLVMDGPAHGLDVATLVPAMFAWQQEVVLVDPRVEVVSVERPDPERVRVQAPGWRDPTIVHVRAA